MDTSRFEVIAEDGVFAVIRTGDGSLALLRKDRRVSYRSVFGALKESQTVFIEGSGFSGLAGERRILELGFGAGINFALAVANFLRSRSGFSLDYISFEREPVPVSMLSVIWDGIPFLEPDFRRYFLAEYSSFLEEFLSSEGMAISWNFSGGKKLDFRLYPSDWRESSVLLENWADVVFHDPFGPADDPESWTEEVFSWEFRWMRRGGVLVTYSCAGRVKRALGEVGFVWEKLPGPPGKREFLRAVKP